MGLVKTHSLYVDRVVIMSRKQILNNLFETIEPIVQNLGLELLDIEFTSDAGRPILRITIYNSDGTTLDHCVTVDKTIGPLLEEMDPIPGSYNLEISSPGLERTLKRDKEYEVFAGKACRVNLYGPIEGKRSYEGLLVGLRKLSEEELIVIRDGNGEVALPRRNVSKVQLVYTEK